MDAVLIEGVRMTIPVREALERAGNAIRQGREAHVWDVELSRPVSLVVVQTLEPIPGVMYGGSPRVALRLEEEPEYPQEHAAAWWDRGAWVACPSCGAALVWYEAGYVPGYRICLGEHRHHAQLSGDGLSARANGRRGDTMGRLDR